MRIDGSNTREIADRKTEDGKRPASAEVAKESGSSGAVVVSIGPAARRLAAEGLPADVSQRLERVRNQLESGSYEIDYARLAHRIADEEIARAGGRQVMSKQWTHGQSTADLTAFGELLESLERLLDEERAAVAQLDGNELARVTHEKKRVGDMLREVSTRNAAAPSSARVAANDQRTEELRVAVKQTARRVAAQAQANAVLLADAVGAVGDVLGVRADAGTYDRRARRTSTRSRSIIGGAL